MKPGGEGWTLLVIAGLALVTVVSRCFFFISNRPWRLPGWVERGLQHAPIAALAAVVVPEIVTTQGQLLHTWHDARLFATAAALAAYAWRRDVLLALVAGMLVFMPLHIGWGW